MAIDWDAFQKGMAACRSSGDPAAQATLEEMRKDMRPDDPCKEVCDSPDDFQRGWDHAIELARAQTGELQQ